MFFLFLIVACLSISQDNLEPVNSKMPSTNLISIAKTDPLALVQMLDGANPGAIKKIVAILKGLIQDGQQENRTLYDRAEEALKKVNASRKRLKELLEIEGQALSELQRRQRIQAIAQGRYNAAVNEYNRVLPGLNKEIVTLTKVLSMLNKLLNDNTPNQKELLELGSTEKGKAYLKLVANVQADPDKLRKIIGYVGTLLAGAKKELKTAADKVTEALRLLNIAKENTRKAAAKHAGAVRERKACDDQLAKDIAAYNAAVSIRDTREAIIWKERATLLKVITLLESTADKE